MAFFTASRLSSLMSPQNNGLVRTFENQMGNKANQSQNDGLFSVFFCLFISGCFSLSTEFMFAVALIITLDKYLSFSDIPPPTLWSASHTAIAHSFNSVYSNRAASIKWIHVQLHQRRATHRHIRSRKKRKEAAIAFHFALIGCFLFSVNSMYWSFLIPFRESIKRGRAR